MRRMRIIDRRRPQVVVDGNRLLDRIGVDREGVADASRGFQKVLDDTRYVSRSVSRLFARSVLWIRGGRFRLANPVVIRDRMSLQINDASFFVD